MAEVEASVTNDHGDNETAILPANKRLKLSLNSDVVTYEGRSMAKSYPFELDTFQKQSIQYIEQNESVLVAAHTSAGKTAVAEYAVALALNNKQRVIYTSPIKALSNQKYRDLSNEFSDVGLLTGDVSINPNASCLVMTTEILRSMLYKGSEIIREVAWAIFDEVHYMRDKTRGVVWEESIILLPHKVRYVFLSATIPNAKQFSDWITKVHHRPCHVVYTDYRPTPLQHFMYPSGGDGIYLIVDEKGNFKQENLLRAMETLSRGGSVLQQQISDNDRERRNNRRSDKIGDLLRLLQMVMQRNYGPCIVFSFSKKDCEKYAKRVSTMELSKPEEAELIEEVFYNAIEGLKDEDKNLPQITSLLPLLKSGIGIHHGGLLPILKEIVEILFGEGLLKVLFATETFAMGINMPARTVIFTAMRKFDGSEIRWVGSGEYIQMSGRAGRRGLDDKGIVIQMVEEVIQPDIAKQIMSGQAAKLSSTFYLSYNMLLNLYRIEDSNPEFIIRNSLFAFQQQTQVPDLLIEVEKLQNQINDIEIDVELEAKFLKYHNTINELSNLKVDLRKIVMQPKYLKGFISPGRVVKLNHPDSQWWSVVLESQQIINADTNDEKLKIILLALCEDMPEFSTSNKGSTVKNALLLNKARPGIKNPIPKHLIAFPDEIDSLSTVRMKINGLNTQKPETVIAMFAAMNENFPNGIPILDPIEDMKITENSLKDIMVKAEALQSSLLTDDINSMNKEQRDKFYANYIQKHTLLQKKKQLQAEIAKLQSLPMEERLNNMKIVLKRLGHLGKDNVIQLKGRVACEISTAHELVTTELLLSGSMNDWSAAKVAAVLSCLVHTEKGEDDVSLFNSELQGGLKKLREIAKEIAEAEKDANAIDTEIDEFVNSFKPDIMEAVFKWCQGAKFFEVMQATSVFEGNLIRCIRRLVELLRQLCSAAKVVGDLKLEAVFKEAIVLMKRDIIFAGSLYLQD